MKFLALIFVSVSYLVACNGIEREKFPQKETNQGMLKFPYKADEKRHAQIDNGIKQIQRGSSSDDVVRFMGNPDEINDTFDKDDWHKKVGFSFVYIKQRDKERGSVYEKNENLIRIHFNLKNKVDRIDHVVPPAN